MDELTRLQWTVEDMYAEIMDLRARLKDVITSYSIHYTKLYERSPTQRPTRAHRGEPDFSVQWGIGKGYGWVGVSVPVPGWQARSGQRGVNDGDVSGSG